MFGFLILDGVIEHNEKNIFFRRQGRWGANSWVGEILKKKFQGTVCYFMI